MFFPFCSNKTLQQFHHGHTDFANIFVTEDPAACLELDHEDDLHGHGDVERESHGEVPFRVGATMFVNGCLFLGGVLVVVVTVDGNHGVHTHLGEKIHVLQAPS